MVIFVRPCGISATITKVLRQRNRKFLIIIHLLVNIFFFNSDVECCDMSEDCQIKIVFYFEQNHLFCVCSMQNELPMLLSLQILCLLSPPLNMAPCVPPPSRPWTASAPNGKEKKKKSNGVMVCFEKPLHCFLEHQPRFMDSLRFFSLFFSATVAHQILQEDG